MGKRNNPNIVQQLPLDKDWIANCFLLPKATKLKSSQAYTEATYKWMYFSSADVKFTNTSLGGNLVVNPPPQYTIFADPPTGLLEHTNRRDILAKGGQGGMGMYYSEAIDDNAHKVTMRFGVPRYKGLITFFGSFYDAGYALLANQGRTGLNVFYFLGKLVGTVAFLGMNVVIWLYQAARMVLSRPATGYYFLQPAMPLFWSRFNMVFNRVLANMGIVPEGRLQVEGKYPFEDEGLVDPEDGNFDQDWKAWGNKYQSYSFEMVKEYMPDLFSDSGGIDVWRVINKTNRMMVSTQDAMYRAALGKGYNGGNAKQEFINNVVTYVRNFKPNSKDMRGRPLIDYLRAYHSSILGATTIKVNGEDVDITYRDAITDRIKEISKLPPTPLGEDGQAAATTETPAEPTAEATTTDASTTTATNAPPPTIATPKPNTPATDIAKTQLTASTPTSSQLAEKKKQAEEKVKAAEKALAKAKESSKKNNSITGGGLATITAENELKKAKEELAKLNSTTSTAPAPTSTASGETVNQASSTVEAPLAGGVLSAAPTGSEAVDLMKEYMKQDTLILSAIQVDEETGAWTRVLGWLKEKSGITAHDYFMDSLKRGGDWFTLRVDAIDSESESWSNTTGQSEIQSTINSTSDAVRAARFSLSNFQTGFSIIDGPIQAVRDTIAGLMSGFNLDGLLALAGSGAVDIPERYLSSSVNLTGNTYSMELRTASGDPLSVALNLYLPFIGLMSGALPISHGNQSYGAPLMCELYVKGRSSVKMGLITDLSVRRGAGTVGWNDDGLPLGIDVSFTVKDLTTIMHMPIDVGLSSLNPIKALMSPDSAYADYLAVLGNLTIYDQTNHWRRVSMRWAAYKINVDNFFNGARLGYWVADFRLVRFATGIFSEPPKVITM